LATKAENERKARIGQMTERLAMEIEETGALTAMREQIYRNIESCAWWNTKELRECRRMLSTISHFESQLKKKIQEGLKAQTHL